MPFLRRHSVPVAIALFGLVMAYLLSDLFAGFQVGIGPEFILKSFAKLFYLGVAWIATHIVIKYFFPTIYAFCVKGNKPESEFAMAWHRFDTDHLVDPRLGWAVATHIGVFAAVCILLALAF